MARSFQPYNWLILVFVFVLLLGGATAMQAVSAPEDEATATDMIPDQHFTDINGKEISLHQFKGKTVLVHFWGTWCPPCVKELPDLLAAVKKNPNSVLIAVSIEHNKLAVTDFLSRIGNADPGDNIHFVLDPTSSIVVGRPVNRYPTTVVIGQDMTIVDRLNTGVDWQGGYSF